MRSDPWTGVREAIRMVAFLGLLLVGTLGVLAAWFVFVFGGAISARSESTQPIALLCLLVGIAAFATAVAVISGKSLVELRRSRIAWVVAALVLGGFAWAFVGIDRLRPVRTLPEANLTYPNARERGRSETPAQGGIDSQARAIVSRGFETPDTSHEVLAFYASKLAESGWTEPLHSKADRYELYNWERDRFTFQIEMPPDEPGVTLRYAVTIYGPPQ